MPAVFSTFRQLTLVSPHQHCIKQSRPVLRELFANDQLVHKPVPFTTVGGTQEGLGFLKIRDAADEIQIHTSNKGCVTTDVGRTNIAISVTSIYHQVDHRGRIGGDRQRELRGFFLSDRLLS